MRPTHVVFSKDRCSCGALVDSKARQCRKCRNRARWLRRKNWQHRDSC
jgi:ribosomal protein L40E